MSSAFFGTISGSAVANVVSTGSFTIPLMKKIGYRPVFAGAVEAVSSTGGQFMPPVALAAFAAAPIANAKPFATGFESMRLAAVAYLVPFFFVYSPVLIWKGSAEQIFLATLTATMGTIALGSGMIGYLLNRLNWGFRILLLVAGLGLIKPGLVTDIFGTLVLGGIYLYQRWEIRRSVCAGVTPDQLLSAKKK